MAEAVGLTDPLPGLSTNLIGDDVMQAIRRIGWWAMLTFLFVALSAPGNAGSANRMKLIVPLGAGGALDRMARAAAEAMSTAANRQVDVENHPPREGGSSGFRTFLGRPADGTSLLAWFEPAVASTQTDDFFEKVAIINVQQIEPPVIAAGAHTGWTSLDDMIQDMQKAPGRFRIGVGGRTAGGSLLALALLDNLGLDATIVEYASGGKARKALLRNEIDIVAGSINSIRKLDDKVVPMATFSPRRSRAWPEVPAIREALGGRSEAAVMGAVYRFIGVHRSFADSNPEAFAALAEDFEIAAQELQNRGRQTHWFGPLESTALLQRAHQHFADLIKRVAIPK